MKKIKTSVQGPSQFRGRGVKQDHRSYVPREQNKAFIVLKPTWRDLILVSQLLLIVKWELYKKNATFYG